MCGGIEDSDGIGPDLLRGKNERGESSSGNRVKGSGQRRVRGVHKHRERVEKDASEEDLEDDKGKRWDQAGPKYTVEALHALKAEMQVAKPGVHTQEEINADIVTKFGDMGMMESTMEMSSVYTTINEGSVDWGEGSIRAARMARRAAARRLAVKDYGDELDVEGENSINVSEEEYIGLNWEAGSERGVGGGIGKSLGQMEDEGYNIYEDVEFGEGYDEYVNDEPLNLGRKQRDEEVERRRAEIAELINQAEEDRESDSSSDGLGDGEGGRVGGWGERTSKKAVVEQVKSLTTCIEEIRERVNRMENKVEERRGRLEFLRGELNETRSREKGVWEKLEKIGEGDGEREDKI